MNQLLLDISSPTPLSDIFCPTPVACRQKSGLFSLQGSGVKFCCDPNTWSQETFDLHTAEGSFPSVAHPATLRDFIKLTLTAGFSIFEEICTTKHCYKLIYL